MLERGIEEGGKGKKEGNRKEEGKRSFLTRRRYRSSSSCPSFGASCLDCRHLKNSDSPWALDCYFKLPHSCHFPIDCL